MNTSNRIISDKVFLNRALEVTIRIGLVVLLAAWCFQIVQHFVVPVIWGIIIVAPVLSALGLATLLLMWIAYYPTWRLYRRIGWAFFALPAAAVLYTLMTIDSAWRHLRGRGGGWKNRTYARERAGQGGAEQAG